MSLMFSRLMRWHRPCNNLHGAIQRSMVRFESTVGQPATESVKANTVSSATSKASDSISRTVSAAGPALKGVGKTLGSIGGQTGQVISLIQRKFSFFLFLLELRMKINYLRI